MNEHFPGSNFDVLDAELVVQDGIQKMEELMGEFNKFGYNFMSYSYLDYNDDYSTVHFTVEDFSTPWPKYFVLDMQNVYGVSVHRQMVRGKMTPTLAGIDKLDKRSSNYVEAKNEDIIQLGEYLDELDVSQLRANYHANIARKNRRQAGFIGRLLRRFDLS